MNKKYSIEYLPVAEEDTKKYFRVYSKRFTC